MNKRFLLSLLMLIQYSTCTPTKLTKTNISHLWHAMARDVRYIEDDNFFDILTEWENMALKSTITRKIIKKHPLRFAAYDIHWETFESAFSNQEMLRTLDAYTIDIPNA